MAKILKPEDLKSGMYIKQSISDVAYYIDRIDKIQNNIIYTTCLECSYMRVSRKSKFISSIEDYFKDVEVTCANYINSPLYRVLNDVDKDEE